MKSAGRASGLVGCGCCLGFVSGLVVCVCVCVCVCVYLCFFGFGEVGFFWQ